MKIPKHLLQPLRNPFVEAKRQELAIAMTKKMLNEALAPPQGRREGQGRAQGRQAQVICISRSRARRETPLSPTHRIPPWKTSSACLKWPLAAPQSLGYTLTSTPSASGLSAVLVSACASLAAREPPPPRHSKSLPRQPKNNVRKAKIHSSSLRCARPWLSWARAARPRR